MTDTFVYIGIGSNGIVQEICAHPDPGDVEMIREAAQFCRKFSKNGRRLETVPISRIRVGGDVKLYDPFPQPASIREVAAAIRTTPKEATP